MILGIQARRKLQRAFLTFFFRMTGEIYADYWRTDQHESEAR